MFRKKGTDRHYKRFGVSFYKKLPSIKALNINKVAKGTKITTAALNCCTCQNAIQKRMLTGTNCPKKLQDSPLEDKHTSIITHQPMSNHYFTRATHVSYELLNPRK
jgi:arginine deiminase